MTPPRLAPVVLAALLGTAPGARAHDVVPPARLEAKVAEVERLRALARTSGDVDALFALGERTEQLVELLNLDGEAHPEGDMLGRLVASRLRACGVNVELSDGRWSYDLGAFREYLARAGSGPRAGEAWYRLLARAFRDRSGPPLAGGDAAGRRALARAVAEEERFLRRYPASGRAREVRFFLAVDRCRVLGASPRPAAVLRRRCTAALSAVLARDPGSLEARTAEALLDEVGAR